MTCQEFVIGSNVGMAQFVATSDWSTFLPAFVATSAGVVLGIPAGVLLNSFVTRSDTRATSKANKKRLSDTLLAISTSLEVNDGALDRLSKKVPSAILLAHGFDLAT